MAPRGFFRIDSQSGYDLPGIRAGTGSKWIVSIQIHDAIQPLYGDGLTGSCLKCRDALFKALHKLEVFLAPLGHPGLDLIFPKAH